MAEGPHRDPAQLGHKRDQVEKAQPLGGAFALLGFYAEKGEQFPLAAHLLIIFGVIFIVVMVLGARDPASIAIMALTLLAAYSIVLFVLSKESRQHGSLRAEADELSGFVGLPPEGGAVKFFVPTSEAQHCPVGSPPYKVHSMAVGDVQAVVEIVSMLAKRDIVRGSSTVDPENLLIDEGAVDTFRAGVLFHIGGPLPNACVRRMIDDNPHIGFEDRGDVLRITCQGIPSDRFAMRPPRKKRTIAEAENEPTYGCILKVRADKCTKFGIWGLDARGTLGAAYWLAQNWRALPEKFSIENTDDFTAIVRLPPRATFQPDPVERLDETVPVLLPIGATATQSPVTTRAVPS